MKKIIGILAITLLAACQPTTPHSGSASLDPVTGILKGQVNADVTDAEIRANTVPQTCALISKKPGEITINRSVDGSAEFIAQCI